MAQSRSPYTIILHSESVEKADRYRQAIARGEKEPGHYFFEILKNAYYREYHQSHRSHSGKRANLIESHTDKSFQEFVTKLQTEEFYKLLSYTKKPVIMAESICADGTDWTSDEVALLAEIVTVADVEIYANGERDKPVPHIHPFNGTIIMVPGLMLTTLEGTNPDRESVVVESDSDPNFKADEDYNVPIFTYLSAPVELIDFEKFYRAYELRMLPALAKVNQQAKEDNETLILTLPGIGTELFRGNFDANYLKSMLTAAIHKMIAENPHEFSEFDAVYLDLYEHGDQEPSTREIPIDGRTLPLHILHTKNHNKEKQLLAHPATFDATYKDCKLINVSAGNAVSLPGNEGLRGLEKSNEATIFRCTNLGTVTTGIRGYFQKPNNWYNPDRVEQSFEQLLGKQPQVTSRASWQCGTKSGNGMTIGTVSNYHCGTPAAEAKCDHAEDDAKSYTSAEALAIIQLYSKFDTSVKLTADNRLPLVDANSSDDHSYLLNPSSRAFLNSIIKRVNLVQAEELAWCERNYKKDNVAAFVKKLFEFEGRQASKGQIYGFFEGRSFLFTVMEYYEKGNPGLADWVISLNEDFHFVKKMLAFCKKNPDMAQRYSKLTPDLQPDLIKYLKENQDHLADTTKTSFDHFLKTKIAAEIRKYNNRCCKFSFFGHHHTKRAAHVINAILTAQNNAQLADILQNQHDLFQKTDTYRSAGVLDDRYGQRDNLKNTKQGGYFAAVTNAAKALNKFSTDGNELVHITPALTLTK